MNEKFDFLDVVKSALGGDLETVKMKALAVARDTDDLHFKKSLQEICDVSTELPIGLYPLKPKKTLEELKLPDMITQIVDDFLTEQRFSAAFVKHKIFPRHKALLVGPPGNGKTVLAGAISLKLGVPAFMVRYDDLISKVPGETSKNLLKLFSYAKGLPGSLLFFDEFDALGRERDNADESGEMKRVVSTLLVQLDDVPPHVVCMAATNHAQMLDSAIWRRFNIRIELPRPRLERFIEFMQDMFSWYGFEIDMNKADLEVVSFRTQFDHFSDAELFVTNCVRQWVISSEIGKEQPMEDVIESELVKWTEGQKKL